MEKKCKKDDLLRDLYPVLKNAIFRERRTMRTVRKYVQEMHEEYGTIIPPLKCKDGFTMSVQHSKSHYCAPRIDYAERYGLEYKSYEVGYPSEKEDILMFFAENSDAPTSTVYSFVPQQIVEQVVEMHGGLDYPSGYFQSKGDDMLVELINFTEDPVLTISVAAGTCYGKPHRSEKRVRNCYTSGHLSVFEHAVATFSVGGISRSCSHQLVRHRLASFCQESQRYVKIDTKGTNWYVVPRDILELDGEQGGAVKRFRDEMRRCADAYEQLLRSGVNPEDARYLLPEATKTNLIVTMNCRELYHFFDMRISTRAQREIRELAEKMLDRLSIPEGWDFLMDLYKAGEQEKE